MDDLFNNFKQILLIEENWDTDEYSSYVRYILF